ncbi:hypothetical protein PGC35_18645 [Psychrobacillus sp. PGGUH221]|uniref:hypothetical protein n=1 Tax=Psychrobacillus sp. PGGUH221 TaxID=3020058 RepID=UPI0035C6D14E
MNQLKDIVRFKKELYFNGAVQVDWFYNKEKQGEISKSFVFHGPEYFGVSEEDLAIKTHRLVDTASFANILTNKLYGESNNSNFFMTIAPYGTGKSHLAVTLASLFSGESSIQEKIINNINLVDSSVGGSIKSTQLKPNLVLVLNGMKDFNLNYEILNVTQKVLDFHNLDSDFLKTITKSYDIAKNFAANTFENYSSSYERFANEILDVSRITNLKDYLIENILQDTNVFEVINNVYYEINGTYIRWDEGVSAGDVLAKIADTLCGDREVFNKVLVFFDEFGRYIEFASSYPTRAGDSALQQIYEAVQDGEDKIVFVGFIQSDLKSYLSRVDRTANINRYIGRYEASEKIHLSSNLETIFANLIERTQPKQFTSFVVNKIEKNNNHWKEFHDNFLSWAPQSKNSTVWGDFDRFRKVILEGIYPLHPLTAWMLSNLSSWLQQRSSLTFLEKQIELEGNNNLSEFGDLLLVPATRIIRTEFFTELLTAEQEGRKQSEYCILYNQIISSHGDKFNERQIEVLAANLIVRIGRFKTKSLSDAKQALAYAANITLKEVELVIQQLEDDFGVISFDERANVFDFVVDAIGINDFKRLVNSKKRKSDFDINVAFHIGLNEILPLEKMETSFAKRHYISTHEWQFTQQIVHINNINLKFLKDLEDEWLHATAPDIAKGKLIWVYTSPETDSEKIQNLQDNMKRYKLEGKPIVFFLMDDTENDFYDALHDYQISNSFSEQEREKYNRFITDYKVKVNAVVEDKFNELVGKRIVIKSEGLEKIVKRPKMYIEHIFETLYSFAIPFPFTEFAGKQQSKGKKNLSRIARLILSGASFQMIHSETTDIKNRIEGLLFEKNIGSWGTFNSEYQLISPTNPNVRKIFEELDVQLDESGAWDVSKVFDKYQKPPYGINDYALALLIAVYLVQRKIEYRVKVNDTRLRLEEWSNQIFLDKNVNFKGLLDTTIVKVDPDKSASRYLLLFQKVDRNNDVDLCPHLWDEYQNLKLEEDVPPELEDKVINLEMQLKEGKKLYELNVQFFGSIRGTLESISRGDDGFKEVFEILDKTSGIKSNIEGSDKYIYNPKQLEEMDLFVDKSHRYIENKFPTFLKSLKCQSFAQLSAFEKWVRKLIDSFNRYNYTDEARQLYTKLEKILDDTSIIHKLQNINETVENYLNRNIPSSTSGYKDLTDMKEAGLQVLSLLKNHKVEQKHLAENIGKVEKNLDRIETYLDKLNNEVANIYDNMYELSSFEQCKELLIQAKTILGKSIREEDKEGIEQAADHLQNFINDIQGINKYKDARKEITAALEGLQGKWKEIESEIDFIIVLSNYNEVLIDRLNSMERRWVEDNIFEYTDIRNWDTFSCTSWSERSKIIPDYLSEDAINKLRKMKESVDRRLEELEIDAVISLFENLTEVQKIAALEKLRELAKV